MTEIKNNVPHQDQSGLPSITLTHQNFREIAFSKQCLEDVTILRKIDDEPWQVIARSTRFPYTDSDMFDRPVRLKYHLKSVLPDGATDDYYLEASLNEG